MVNINSIQLPSDGRIHSGWGRGEIDLDADIIGRFVKVQWHLKDWQTFISADKSKTNQNCGRV